MSKFQFSGGETGEQGQWARCKAEENDASGRRRGRAAERGTSTEVGGGPQEGGQENKMGRSWRTREGSG